MGVSETESHLAGTASAGSARIAQKPGIHAGGGDHAGRRLKKLARALKVDLENLA
jgi:hypothetical protein